jgi:hypothetical protein
VWATNRICNNAAGEGSVLVLQDDGNIAVYCAAGRGVPNIVSDLEERHLVMKGSRRPW